MIVKMLKLFLQLYLSLIFLPNYFDSIKLFSDLCTYLTFYIYFVKLFFLCMHERAKLSFIYSKVVS